MKIDDLRNALALGDTLRCGKAAETRKLPLATFLRQLDALEAELGQTLFRRTPRGVSVTPVGETFLAHAREMVQAHEQMLFAIRERRAEGATGRVAVCEPESDSFYYSSAAAAAVRRDNPGVRFDSTTGNTREVLEGLRTGVFDFGIVNGPFRSQEFHGLPLRHAALWGVLLRKDSPYFPGRASLRLDELSGHPLIVPAPGGVNEAFRVWYGTEAPALRCVGTYNVDARAAMLVESGLCHALCVGKRIYGFPWMPFRFLPVEPARPARYVMLWRRGTRLSQAAGLFLAQMKRLAPLPIDEVCAEIEAWHQEKKAAAERALAQRAQSGSLP